MPKVLAHRLDWRDFLFGAGFALALLFGGGGAEGPFQNGLISAIGALLLGIIAADHFSGARPLQTSASLPLTIIGLLLIVAALQLVPLPASIWQSLSGRELVVSGLQQIGADGLPRPVSIDPRATAGMSVTCKVSPDRAPGAREASGTSCLKTSSCALCATCSSEATCACCCLELGCCTRCATYVF